MSSSSSTTTSNDQCEHCHSTYTFIKKKKNCAVCHQSYCANCAPRERYQNQPIRICLTCQLISNTSTTNDQLLALKVKHLKSYLKAKDISNDNCTEKQELVNLIINNRNLPFTHVFTQPTQTNQQQSQTTVQPPPQPQTPKSDNNSKPFANLQSTVSSFANQMNSFATNIQDYVTNTVSGVINQTLPDQPQQSTTTTNNNNSNNGASFSFSSAPDGSFNHSSSSSGNTTHTRTATANSSTTTNPQQQQQRPPPPAATTSSSSTAKQKPRQKSLSEINEENIEDLNIRELKEILAANFVDFKGCVEKGELIEKVRRLYRDRLNAQLKARELDDSVAGDNELCKICMDAIADCVFLDCGHMVTCVKCEKIMAPFNPKTEYSKLETEDIRENPSSEYVINELTSSTQSSDSISSNDSFEPQTPKRPVVKSCFWSTAIFSLNFVSSIFIINLSKWIYVKHHFPNLTLTTMNFFMTFILLLICLQAKLFTYVRLPILKMLPVSACFGGFIAFSNLSLQYNTVGTYQLTKLQVTPSMLEK
ncbi:unnamed protein product [Adineta steineri]|uniref:FYVE-type domain-containing protein n=3 Tax=Adineta steineri TaxID=433720 RepID=A0A814YSH7_9BILA|nr:unnamed protein product [Adineta steineri]